MMILGDVNRWFNDNGDNTHRLNYDLTKNSIVFDLGAHTGWFTRNIYNRYGCKVYAFEPIDEYFQALKTEFHNNENVKLHKVAVSNYDGIGTIYVDGVASSSNSISEISVQMEVVNLKSIMNLESVSFIDLIKINIEGDEYNLLEDMILNQIHTKCENIQVQFHRNIENYQYRYELIKNELQKTHSLTYNYPFVWENWKLK